VFTLTKIFPAEIQKRETETPSQQHKEKLSRLLYRNPSFGFKSVCNKLVSTKRKWYNMAISGH